MKLKATIAFVCIAATAIIFSFLKKEKEQQAADHAKTELEKQNASAQQKANISRTDQNRFKGDITIGLDNYLGYFPLRSPRLRNLMLNEGYKLEFLDDQADYQKRSAALRNGELDFAVFTVDSYILNNAPKFPGQIVMVISESMGADAIVTTKDIKTINDLNEVTVTLNSPSHQLVKACTIDFGLDTLKQNIRPANGSEDALQQLLDGQTKAAVLWEPDISTALNDPRFKTLISTESTSKLIVDILVASDQVVHQHPEKLNSLLTHYFPTLRYYEKNPEILSRAIQQDSKLPAKATQRIIDSISWQSLNQNASLWFGIRSPRTPLAQFKIIETIDLTDDILTKFGDFPSSPLPASGAFSLLSSKTIATLHARQSDGQLITAESDSFKRLSPHEWKSLDPVASLRIDPIGFKRGTRELDSSGQESLKNIKNLLARYPHYRLRIEGHTSTKGDPEINRTLSQERADAIRQHLVRNFNIPATRILAQGIGSDKPLPRSESLSYRAWLSSLPRVEFHLLEEIY
ncbi:OmpA family protein [Rubritalea tangerina]|uniref:OmpA family protein n=1 Tax=Rubritalea tangerina TaxID=430798 RepID=A0ABW4ZA74_9BACT